MKVYKIWDLDAKKYAESFSRNVWQQKPTQAIKHLKQRSAHDYEIHMFQLYKTDKHMNNIIGFHTLEELAAYEKGRDHEQNVIIDFLGKWEGSTNSVMGQILKEFVDKHR